MTSHIFCVWSLCLKTIPTGNGALVLHFFHGLLSFPRIWWNVSHKEISCLYYFHVTLYGSFYRRQVLLFIRWPCHWEPLEKWISKIDLSSWATWEVDQSSWPVIVSHLRNGSVSWLVIVSHLRSESVKLTCHCEPLERWISKVDLVIVSHLRSGSVKLCYLRNGSVDLSL